MIQREVLAMINADSPQNHGFMYTQMSQRLSRAVKYGEAGIFINYLSCVAKRPHAATGKHCSNYRAESEPLMKVVSIVKN